MRLHLVVLAISLFPSLALSQAGPPSPAPPSQPGIQDNSFLIEEAYNQETGVVQHIGTFRRNRGSSDFEFAFTQEWPFRSIVHQLSYDVPIVRNAAGTGIGDVSLNYRYQAAGDGAAPLAVAPRLSVSLPTGSWRQARGSGAVGIEVNLPVSYVLSPSVVTHFNAGASATPSARNTLGEKATVSEAFLGQSLIVTSSPRIQPMVEFVYAVGREVAGDHRTHRGETMIVSPGVRGAFNLSSGLQIVPGLAIPIGIGPSSGETGLFVYLSFEHSFSKSN